MTVVRSQSRTELIAALNTLSTGCIGASWSAEMVAWGGPGYDADGQIYNVVVTSGSGHDYNVAATDTPETPEPSSALLLLCGSILMIASRLRISSLRRS